MTTKTTTKPKIKLWTEAHEKKYEWLFNYIIDIYPQAKKDTFIDVYKNELLHLIKNNENWGDSSKESLYFLVARYLDIKNDKLNKKYKDEGFKLMLSTQEKENKNELDEKEKQNFRTHDYFINILNNIKVDEIQTLEQHYKYLLLSLLVLQAPLRTSFYTSAKIILNKKDDDKLNNFILLNRRGGNIKAYFIVNRDKATNYKLYATNKNLSKIEIKDVKLTKIINDSYNKYKRIYLFQLSKKPISDNTFLNWLRDITKTDKINNDMMRSSFITYFYENNLKFGDRDKLSKIMRHSTTTAQRNYNKVFRTNIINNDEDDIYKNIKDELGKLKNENESLKNKLKETDKAITFNLDNKQYKKRRNDVLYNLNTKGRSPRETTLKEYNITYDVNKKIYI